MARFPWLLPVIGIVAALAVGVAAVIIGVRFATPATVTTSSGTTIVPVLRPVAVGADQIAALKTANLAKATPSPVSGQARITQPGTSTAIDPTLAHALDAAAHSSSPAFDRATGPITPAIAGDPCAITPTPSGCLNGLLGAVAHRLDSPPPFAFKATAFPPTTAEYQAGTRWFRNDHCDATPSSAIPIGILATAPGTYHVALHAVDDPRSITIVSSNAPTPAEIAAYTTALAAADFNHPLAPVTGCLNVTGLRSNTAYEGVLSATDYHGSTDVPFIFYFNTSGRPTHPGAQISTLGQNLIIAQGLHSSGERVVVRAWSLRNDVVADCNTPSGDEVSAFTSDETTASAGDIAQLNAPSNYGHRTTVTFDVPEGSTIMVCARWYPASPAPSWQQQAPNFESRAILESPDRILPTVSLVNVESGTTLQAFISTSTVEGRRCGQFGWNRNINAPSLNHPVSICDNYWLARGGAATLGGRLWDNGFRGDLVVSITTVNDSDRHTQQFVLPTSAENCFGTCTLPDPTDYLVPLTDNNADGTAQIEVNWTQGNTNGRTNWVVTPNFDRTIASPTPANYPQLNTDAAFAVHHTHADQDWAQAAWTMSVDREASWDLKLTLAPGVAAPSCKPGAGPLEWRGHVYGGIPIPFAIDGLCLGTDYRAELTLEDNLGHSNTWAESNLASWWGANSHVHVPGVRAVLQYTVDVQGPAQSELTQFDMTAAGVSLPDGVDPAQLCDDSGHFHGTAQRDVVLSSHTTIRVDMYMSRAGIFSEVRRPDGTGYGFARCDENVALPFVTAMVTFDLNAVLYTSGQDAPCEGQNLSIDSTYQVRINVCALYAGPGS